MFNKSITVIGGGLSGLSAAILLNRAGFEVHVVEKKSYPFNRVCGEYISNEVLPFFTSLGISISDLQASTISKFAISSPRGNLLEGNLDLGGFGLSRYTLDQFLYQKAKDEGVHFLLNTKANSITFLEDEFEIELSDAQILRSSMVIAAYGKRSNLDKNRSFFYKRTAYMGVKYHIKTDFPIDLIQLDNFEGGYCGTVKIEKDLYNLCYLSENRNLKKHGSIPEMEREVLFKNTILKARFENADFLIQKPEVINEISFEQKPVVENHILYCGDAAGMISPLCGNGMSMAIHAAKILSETIIQHFPNRQTIEKVYEYNWRKQFEKRLRVGHFTQKLFGSSLISELALKSLTIFPKISTYIMKRTHGSPF